MQREVIKKMTEIIDLRMQIASDDSSLKILFRSMTSTPCDAIIQLLHPRYFIQSTKTT
jgi:hypothetical protein